MDEKKPKRRGRKAKKSTQDPKIKKQPKKRGRKPKGGKIIKKKELDKKENTKLVIPNIILHLKASTKELKNAKISENTLDSYTFENTTQLAYKNLDTISSIPTQIYNDDFDWMLKIAKPYSSVELFKKFIDHYRYKKNESLGEKI